MIKVYIGSLLISEELDFDAIKNWLYNNKQIFIESLKNPCAKWQNWIKHSEEPYPCCCSIKHESCQFTEFYYWLNTEVNKDEPDLFYIKNYINRNLKQFEI